VGCVAIRARPAGARRPRPCKRPASGSGVAPAGRATKLGRAGEPWVGSLRRLALFRPKLTRGADASGAHALTDRPGRADEPASWRAASLSE
jgi:hypothetical protein